MIKKIIQLLGLVVLLPAVFATTYYLQVINPNDYDLSNFQVRVNLTKYNIEPPIAQITTLDGSNIPFCYEQPNGECNQTITEVIWMKVPLIKAKDYTVVKVIVNGTNGAVDGYQVFDFYDAFNDGIIDTNKWEMYTNYGTISEENGYLKLTVTSTGEGHEARVLSKSTFSLPIVIEMRFRMDGSGDSAGRHEALFWYDSSNHLKGGFDIAATDYPFQYWRIVAIVDGSSSWNEVYDSRYDPDANWISVKVILKQDGGIIYKLDDGTKLEEAIFNFPYTTGNVGLQHWYSESSTYTDWIRVRKYADQDPVVKIAYSKSDFSPQSPSQTSTEYNQTYLYVRQVTVLPENSVSISNAQVILELDTQSLIADGKMQSDCSDIYVTYYDHLYGEIPAKFWVDPTTCNTKATRIYIKLPTISVNNDWIVNVYYGSPGAIPMWDPKNAFTFYVDLTNPSDISQNLIIRTEGSATLDYTNSGLVIQTGSDGKVLMVNK